MRPRARTESRKAMQCSVHATRRPIARAAAAPLASCARTVRSKGGVARTRSLLARDPLNVDDPLLAVALHNLALAPVVVSPHHLDLVVLAHRHRAHVVLVAELRRESRAHDLAPDGGGRGEVRLARLPPRRADGCDAPMGDTSASDHAWGGLGSRGGVFARRG